MEAAPGFEPGNTFEMIDNFKQVDTRWTQRNKEMPKEKLFGLTKNDFDIQLCSHPKSAIINDDEEQVLE